MRIDKVSALCVRCRMMALVLAVSLPSFCLAQHKPYHGDGIDDYLRFVPVVSAYALKAAGVDSRSTWKRLLVNSATSFAINAAFTYGLKYTVKSTACGETVTTGPTCLPERPSACSRSRPATGLATR